MFDATILDFQFGYSFGFFPQNWAKFFQSYGHSGGEIGPAVKGKKGLIFVLVLTFLANSMISFTIVINIVDM